MNRGYIKFWRDAEDSVSWTRGLAHRGLMVTILSRAAWKPRHELGVRVEPGEFLVKVSVWAESLGMPQTTLRRILGQLVADGFIALANVANRHTRVCVRDWRRYRQEEEGSRRTDGDGAAKRRLTGGMPAESPLYREEEGKKETRKKYNPPNPPEQPCPPLGHSGQKPVRRQAYPPEFESFYALYPRRENKVAACRAWNNALREPDATPEGILCGLHNWLARGWFSPDPGYVQHPATWLNNRRWKEQPAPAPGPGARASPGGAALAANNAATILRVVTKMEANHVGNSA